MKIENKYFSINISVKIEKKKSIKVPMIMTLSAILLLALGIGGFTYIQHQKAVIGTENASTVNTQETVKEETAEKLEVEEEFSAQPEGNYVTGTYLASAAKDRYKEENLYGYTYADPIKDLSRDGVIELDMEFDADALGIENWYDIFAIYQDPELKYRMSPICEYNKETKKVTISPTNYPVGNISTLNLSTDTVTKYDHSNYRLFEKDSGKDWGNLNTLYLACYRDMKTGELLDQPIVRVITLKGEIENSPKITFQITDDGRASFQWNAVEGAEEYFVCYIDMNETNGMTGSAYPIGSTSETSWDCESPDFTTYSSTNKEFKYFDVSEEDWFDEYQANRAKEKYGITEGVYKDKTYSADSLFCVVAVNKNGTSMISNTYALSDLAANLPYQLASNKAKQEGSTSKYEKVEQISPYSYVTMCDGVTSEKLIDFKTDQAKVVDVRYIVSDEDGSNQRGENIATLKIPYIIEGTPFEYVVNIPEYDEVNLEKDLAFLEEREEKLRKKSGDIPVSSDAEVTITPEEENLANGEDLQVREVTDMPITANCSLSEYLAMNMLGGASIINLSDFPEADDPKFLDDAWREAYYQNPLILGSEGYRMNRSGNMIKVVYDDTALVTAEKQNEIKEMIPKIVSQIITNDMTDLEKELAINQYLCDTIVYDEEALANAEENNFLSVDDEFKDSFTAYGALIKGKSVCAGYAGAFKLLCDAVGLKAVVVTGILEGSLSHAWNKVQIDGEWQIIDVTNNDNEYLFNALLNLPDTAGDKVLVEDKDYVVDKYLNLYTATKEENEFYRINDKYFSYKEIAQQLAAQLTEDGKAQLRTEYDLNDEIFGNITDEVFEIMGDDTDLYGFYWMGVIYLSISK